MGVFTSVPSRLASLGFEIIVQNEEGITRSRSAAAIVLKQPGGLPPRAFKE
jgi:hypothetical protein